MLITITIRVIGTRLAANEFLPNTVIHIYTETYTYTRAYTQSDIHVNTNTHLTRRQVYY